MSRAFKTWKAGCVLPNQSGCLKIIAHCYIENNCILIGMCRSGNFNVMGLKLGNLTVANKKKSNNHLIIRIFLTIIK